MRLKYNEALKNAEHLRALNIKAIYLEDAIENLPWDLVTRCSAGTMRLGMISRVWFSAYNPEYDLYFEWTVDLEEKEANGKGGPLFDIGNYKFVIRNLENEMKEEFRSLVEEGLMKIRQDLVSWRNQVSEQINYCDELLLLLAEIER